MWLPDPSSGYSITSAYHLLTLLIPVMMEAHKDIIWNKVVPLKISLFPLILLNNRLPSTDNLICRTMHLEVSTLCLEGFEIEHLIVGCDMSSSLKIKILNRLSIFCPLSLVKGRRLSFKCYGELVVGLFEKKK
jgi:hypothetical protein